ncbi:MAG TPA: RNA polymerase sigma factor [Candidatus Polarisedimenticolaceae bacterium]|nr:RNA polymerase sigma factor [Candidatus Polarisedimenticolaceae bacterium]
MSDQRDGETPVQHALEAKAATEPDLERVYRDHHRRVLQAAYRVTGSAQDAEDVLQTVFLRLVRREGSSPLSDSLGNYLHRAAVNAALDVVRSRKASRSTPLDSVEPTLAAGSETTPDAIQSEVEIKQRIRTALARMSAKAGEIFVLRYFEGYGNHEIATMLGTSRSTVNVILHRTREKLRGELASYLGETP